MLVGDSMKKYGSTRIVYSGGRTVEVKRTNSHVTVILQEKGRTKSKNFSAKEGTTVEISENSENVSVTLRPSRGKIKTEIMNFN
jgi:hypothetical protein